MADDHAFLVASEAALSGLRADRDARATVAAMASRIADAFRAGGRLLIAGNGGSAADAQHIATEFVVRLVADRRSLPAIALTTDTSVLTACGNDYGFDAVFARQVEGLGRPGDVFLGISTSGNSPNVLRALEAARRVGLGTLGLTGSGGGGMAERTDLLFRAASDNTAIIQQIHMAVAHLVCAKVERELF